jgi:DNA-binding transcriptional MerR regulator
MADDASTEKELLEPIEASELLKALKLTTGKAAQFAGVSRRQLCYWTDTGIVPSVEGGDDDSGNSAGRRTYDFDALHRVLLIKQALEQSSGLRRAAREVEKHLAERRRSREELIASIEQKRDEFLTEQADRLDAVVAQAQQLLPRLSDRAEVLELHRALDWLDRITDRVQAGHVLLEEDAEACLRLASLIDQAEAKLDSMGSPQALSKTVVK